MDDKTSTNILEVDHKYISKESIRLSKIAEAEGMPKVSQYDVIHLMCEERKRLHGEGKLLNSKQ